MTSFATVEINPNLRFRDEATVADLDEDVLGDIAVGDVVAVWERGSGITGRAWVSDVDIVNRQVRLVVDWANLRIDPQHMSQLLAHTASNNLTAPFPMHRQIA